MKGRVVPVPEEERTSTGNNPQFCTHVIINKFCSVPHASITKKFKT
jgi:hypothetical protein